MKMYNKKTTPNTNLLIVVFSSWMSLERGYLYFQKFMKDIVLKEKYTMLQMIYWNESSWVREIFLRKDKKAFLGILRLSTLTILMNESLNKITKHVNNAMFSTPPAVRSGLSVRTMETQTQTLTTVSLCSLPKFLRVRQTHLDRLDP